MDKFDFSGYATRNDLKCSDGRTIKRDAFKDNDGQKVPLVWQHMHNDPGNVLGHAILENRADGVYTFCKFNDTEAGKNAAQLVRHGDITALSIYANGLVQKGADVIHGAIREVSLVLAGANPGARIDNLAFEHGDGSVVEDMTEAIMYVGGILEHASGAPSMNLLDIEEDGGDAVEDKTVGEVFDTLTEEQKNVVYAMIAEALDEDSMEQDAFDDEGGTIMKRNIFDQEDEVRGPVLSHSDIQEIMGNAQKIGSLKASVEDFLQHLDPVAGVDYGIKDIDILFPDARTVTPTPEMIMRENSWVAGVMSGTRHIPFSRIKSTAADITAEEARALGYVKGSKKKEEVIKLLKRVTGPCTVYKKQKLDRDDIIDITDLDVVGFLKMEMRMMLNEELARAFLIGDGRDSASEDKINEECIRPIYKDDDMYSHHVEVAADKTFAELIDEVVRSRKEYKGTGTPTFFTTPNMLTEMLLLKEGTNGSLRRLYATEAELAAALRVSKIVEVPVMEGVTRTVGADLTERDLNLIGIIVNLNDYTVGADKGGDVNLFDDFDIDFNQYKYLMETRCSACLTKPKSALVIEQVATEVVG